MHYDRNGNNRDGRRANGSYQYYHPACVGLNNGNVTITASGGTPPYSYQWNNSQTTATAANLASGTYMVTVTGSNGCTTTATATVGTAAAPTAVISTITPACVGLNNGNVTITASGSASPYTFKWSNNQTTATAANLASGTYVVTVTSNNGCTTTATATIGTAAAPTAVISTITPACSGFNNGSATVTATDGATPYTYQWSNNQTTATASNLAAGTYTVTVTGSNGCSTTATANVGTAAVPTAVISTITPACVGLNNGNVTITASGGASPYTYLWNNSQTTATAANLASGTYMVTVTGSNGCTTTATATVGTATAPTAVISIITPACSGLSNGSATVTASGGTSPYTYQWNNSQTTATATNLAVGNYIVTVTGTNGCTATAPATVETATAPTATIISTVTACTGQSNGLAAVSAAGGNNFIYLWSNGQTGATASNLVTGNYTVTVTNSNGCATSTAATIGTTPATTAAFTVSLNGQTASFDNISTNATSYAWDFGNGATSTQASPATDLGTGAHAVCLTATGICGSDTTCRSIVVNPPGWDPVVCNTGSVHSIGVLSTAITNIDGQPLTAGDFVGFFHTDLMGANVCNNAGVWTGTSLVLEVCGDNPATPTVKEGYSPGENFLVRVWKDSVEHKVVACYLPKDTYGANDPNATGSFAPFGLSYIECLKTPPAPGTALGCSSPIPIACGETKTGNSGNGTAAASSYSCFPNLVDGEEVVYQFTNNATQNVLITLTGLQADLELLLLDACDRNQCTQFSDRTGTSSEAIFVQNLPAGTYFIVVEGYLGSQSTYSLKVQCGNNITNETLNCVGATPISCNQTLTGNTNTGSDQIINYSCGAAYTSGKERVYSFTSQTNKFAFVRLNGLSADLDLFVLDQCNPNACNFASNKSGTEDEAIVFYATAGKPFYIIVDGYFDAEGAYSLNVGCADPCTDPADCPYEIGGPGNQQIINAQVVQCGIPVSGNNSNGQANASFYDCPSSYNNGKEVVYRFDNPSTQDISVIVSGLSANLDLYLLNGPSIFNCLANSHKSGNSDEGLVVQALPAGTYYIVVDGYNGALSGYSLVVNCSNSALVCQQIDLVAGTNFVSSNILPIDPAIDAMFLPSAQSKIISIESQGNLSYSPSAQTDPDAFGDWDFRKAYRIKALEASSFEVCGEKADPDTPIPFVAKTPQGQAVNNWSAYLKDEPAQVGDKFTPALTPKIFRVWNMPTGPTGTLTPQSWLVTVQGGTNFQLESGRGYILNASMDGDYSFGFSGEGANDRSSYPALPLVVENGCIHFQTPYFNSMKSATVIFPKTVLGQKLTPGDEIGIFRQDGSLFGSGRYNGFGLSIVVSGNEVATPDFSEGFAEDETMIFRLWKSAERKVFDLQATFQSGNGDFKNEAVYFVNELEILEVSAVQAPNSILQWAVYPNPAWEMVWFDLILPQTSTVHLELFSADGRQVRDIAEQEMLAGRTVLNTETNHLATGYYLVKMTTGQNVSFKKIIIFKN